MPLELLNHFLFSFVQKRRMGLSLKLIWELRIFISIQLYVCQQGHQHIFFVLFKPLSSLLRCYFSCQSLSTPSFVSGNPTEQTKLKLETLSKKSNHQIQKNKYVNRKLFKSLYFVEPHSNSIHELTSNSVFLMCFRQRTAFLRRKV